MLPAVMTVCPASTSSTRRCDASAASIGPDDPARKRTCESIVMRAHCSRAAAPRLRARSQLAERSGAHEPQRPLTKERRVQRVDEDVVTVELEDRQQVEDELEHEDARALEQELPSERAGQCRRADRARRRRREAGE